ncbi:hypothetical protein KOW79_021041 [Hemibagrus wyckioides]|uniref:Uncharacterized protein n=1 Tax=Hemibagrus wyckioides TaxID=337641 RepID=A0A9D3SA82_9TELE|nr:hypothetical protein KOW79_021041 [Hemibagrus wyckioides]
MEVVQTVNTTWSGAQVAEIKEKLSDNGDENTVSSNTEMVELEADVMSEEDEVGLFFFWYFRFRYNREKNKRATALCACTCLRMMERVQWSEGLRQVPRGMVTSVRSVALNTDLSVEDIELLLTHITALRKEVAELLHKLLPHHPQAALQHQAVLCPGLKTEVKSEPDSVKLEFSSSPECKPKPLQLVDCRSSGISEEPCLKKEEHEDDWCRMMEHVQWSEGLRKVPGGMVTTVRSVALNTDLSMEDIELLLTRITALRKEVAELLHKLLPHHPQAALQHQAVLCPGLKTEVKSEPDSLVYCRSSGISEEPCLKKEEHEDDWCKMMEHVQWSEGLRQVPGEMVTTVRSVALNTDLSMEDIELLLTRITALRKEVAELLHKLLPHHPQAALQHQAVWSPDLKTDVKSEPDSPEFSSSPECKPEPPVMLHLIPEKRLRWQEREQKNVLRNSQRGLSAAPSATRASL